jgi:hypothetical protein
VEVLDDGAFRFVRPDGQSFESPLPPSQGFDRLLAEHAERQIVIGPQTAVTRWTGEALDLGLAVAGLVQRAARNGNVSAGTPNT